MFTGVVPIPKRCVTCAAHSSTGFGPKRSMAKPAGISAAQPAEAPRRRADQHDDDYYNDNEDDSNADSIHIDV